MDNGPKKGYDLHENTFCSCSQFIGIKKQIDTGSSSQSGGGAEPVGFADEPETGRGPPDDRHRKHLGQSDGLPGRSAPFLVSAYESLAGIAGYYWFTAKAEQYDDDPRFPFVEVNGEHPQFKLTCSTPAVMGGFPAAALVYRNGYLKSAGSRSSWKTDRLRICGTAGRRSSPKAPDSIPTECRASRRSSRRHKPAWTRWRFWSGR